MKDKIKIAFITQEGLNTGGTERFLQTIAANLPQDRFLVDYYYTPEAAPHRRQYMLEHNVNLYEYHAAYHTKYRYIYMRSSDFFEVYKGGYDLIQLGRCGYPQEPITDIRDTPIIDSLHYISGVDNQYNISRVMHISEFSRDMWVQKGGDPKRVEMISLPLYLPEFRFTDIRKRLGLREDCFLFGFHQANRDAIFSDIPLKAYREIENQSNAFVVCNGSRLYREQAKTLGLKNVYFFDYLANDDEFYSVIKSLDVYAHGRKDGELNSAAIAEALSFGLPIITHPSDAFNGHLEVVNENGFVANDYLEYAQAMECLQQDEMLRRKCSSRSLEIFQRKYNFDEQMKNIIRIYEEALTDPYPGKSRRCLLDFRQKSGNILKKFLIELTQKK